MVVNIGLNKKQEQALDRLMTSAHNIRMTVRLLDLNHNHLKDLTPHFVDGLVTVDADAQITRALDIKLFDPQSKVDIDPDSPGRASVFIADMISVIYTVTDPARTVAFNIPVFCGPISSVDRDDLYINVKCLGKESLSLSNFWAAKQFKKGVTKTGVAKTILVDMYGELPNKIDIPNKSAKLPDVLKLNHEKVGWDTVKSLLRSIGIRVFYDGRGVVKDKKSNTNSAVVMDKRWLAAEPQVSYDLSSVINAVWIVGGKPNKKAKKVIQYRQVAPRSHPLSPYRLGRGTAPRYLWLRIEDDSIRSLKEAKARAKKELAQGLLAGVDVQWDGIPNPRLEEWDVVKIRSDTVNVAVQLKKFTIPLTAGKDATYGYLRPRRPVGGAVGVKRKKKKKPPKK